MRNRILFLCTIAVVGSAAQARDIYRCVAPNGDVTLTNLKCPADTSVHLVGTYEPVPDSKDQRLDAAIQAADISAQQAHEAALRAQSVANQAAQMMYEGAPAEPQGYEQSGDQNVYFPAWVPGYPFDGQFDAHFPGHRQHQRSYARAGHPEAHVSRHAHSANAYPQLPEMRCAHAQYPARVQHPRPTVTRPPVAQTYAATVRHW